MEFIKPAGDANQAQVFYHVTSVPGEQALLRGTPVSFVPVERPNGRVAAKNIRIEE